MIVTPHRGKKPVVRHNLDREVRNGVSKILRAFIKELGEQKEKMIVKKYIRKEHLFKDEATRGEILLSLRKKLVFTLRKGMLEREDLEVEIGVLAAMVWFGRQKKEQQDSILNEL